MHHSRSLDARYAPMSGTKADIAGRRLWASFGLRYRPGCGHPLAKPHGRSIRQ